MTRKGKRRAVWGYHALSLKDGQWWKLKVMITKYSWRDAALELANKGVHDPGYFGQKFDLVVKETGGFDYLDDSYRERFELTFQGHVDDHDVLSWHAPSVSFDMNVDPSTIRKVISVQKHMPGGRVDVRDVLAKSGVVSVRFIDSHVYTPGGDLRNTAEIEAARAR